VATGIITVVRGQTIVDGQSLLQTPCQKKNIETNKGMNNLPDDDSVRIFCKDDSKASEVR
jgi:hypothetical protein